MATWDTGNAVASQQATEVQDAAIEWNDQTAGQVEQTWQGTQSTVAATEQTFNSNYSNVLAVNTTEGAFSPENTGWPGRW